MSNEVTLAALFDKLVTPVIVIVLAFMATWVFTINTDVAVIKTKMQSVDAIVLDQRNVDKMMVLLEQQTKANTELVNEVKNSQKELTDAMVEMKLAFAKFNHDYPEWPPIRPKR